MQKLQLFYVYKFKSNRLKEYCYNITITPDEARKNGELVAVGDSQALRTIRQITKSQYANNLLKELENKKKLVKLKKTNKENITKLKDIQSQIDKILHIPEYISVVVESKNDYKKIVKKGLVINNIKYVRLMCGAGHARKNTVIFCASHIEIELKNILKNGMKNIEMSRPKYNAYFALYSSATYAVSSPRVCVIPDCIVNNIHKVDWVEERKEGDTVEEREMELEFNLWDGMGIISPKYAEKWAIEMGIKDYTPSAFRISKSFIKGMVCVFDFHKFKILKAHDRNMIKDVWGNDIGDINDYDMIITKSQFKLTKAYKSWEEYEKHCIKNNITWGISKVSPKEDKNSATLNYQYIQAISLDDEGMKSLCEPTIQWVNDILGNDVMKSLLFLSGNGIVKGLIGDILNIDNMTNIIASALILNNEIINDPYVKDTILHSIRQVVKKACIGKLLARSNYQVMISDPYAMCEYMFGMPVKGLLADKEHYSQYWNNQSVDKVVAMRSPLTWRSEVNMLNLQNSELTNNWYKYINSGIIYNIHGIDTMLHADSDWDMDIVMTTNSKEFLEGTYGGLPITYKKNLTIEGELIESELYNSDLYSFNSKIGVVTNHSTSLYCILSEYQEDSDEYNEIIKRLKICRKEQGSQIDRAKGLIVQEFPKEWISEQEILDTDTEDVKNHKEFMNKLIIRKKPMFMKWLYSNYNNKYKKVMDNANTYCEVNFGCNFNELLNKPYNEQSQLELNYIDEINKYIPLNNAPCIMNKLCKYMEGKKFDFKKFAKDSGKFDYKILIDENNTINENSVIYKEVYKIYKSFTDNKHLHATISTSDEDESDNKEKHTDDNLENLQQMYEYYKTRLSEVCVNGNLLANIAVDICYRKHPSANKDFVWKLCSEGLLQNIKQHRQEQIYIPIKDINGTVDYLGEIYLIKGVEII